MVVARQGRIDRAPYEFSDHTKIEALRRADWTCECCGIKKKDAPDGYLELHHRLGIAIAVRQFPELSNAVIKSVENCMCLCATCHKMIDHTKINNQALAKNLVERYELRQEKVGEMRQALATSGRRRV